MDENLMNLMTEDEIIDLPVEDVRSNVTTEEIIPDIVIEPEEEIIIDIDEGMGWVSGDGRYHDSLLGVDLPRQHPIEAITNLREELNEIERLKTVYSDKFNVANYYKWKDAAYDIYGYFVSVVETDKIQLCNGEAIFGVVVKGGEFPDAGFIGGQDVVSRDNTYGLVVTSGLVDVRCELDVNTGDFVVSNSFGYAKKSSSNYGYRVLGTETKSGVPYAVIALGAQADVTNALGENLQAIDTRLDTAETNIISAINVANQAYNKVGEIGVSNQEMSDKVDGALGVVDKVVADVENLGEQVSNSVLISVQAKAIADSAATSAMSMRNEAVEKANEALASTSELKNRFDEKILEIDTKLYDSVLDLERVKEDMEETRNEMQESIDEVVEDFDKLAQDMEPLATWTGQDGKAGSAGFVARANEDSATLASIVVWKGDSGDSLAGFVQTATEENAEVKALANYTYTDINGVEHKSVAALDAYAKDNEASINLIAGVDGGLAVIQAQVNENAASVAALASHTVGDYVSIETWVATDKDTNKIYYAKDTKYYWYYDNGWKSADKPYEAGLTGAIAGIQQTADDNAASIEMITNLDGDFGKSLAGFVSEATAENAEIKALAEYGYTDDKGEEHYGAAGIMAEVDKNKSAIEAIAGKDGSIAGLQAKVEENNAAVDLIARRVDSTYKSVDTWNDNDKDTNAVYYAKDTKTYWYYTDGAWQHTTNASEAGLSPAIAGIQVQTDENSSSIDGLVGWQDDTNIAMARIEQKADSNGAYIQSTIANLDKYSVGPLSQSNGFTLDQAKSILTTGIIYVPTDTHTETTPVNRDFTKQYYYTWDGEKWVTSNSVAVAFFDNYLTGGSIIYWYIPGADNIVNDGITYNSHTLYKWESNQWVGVATLAGNAQNRAISNITQTSNKISAEVVNAIGDYASLDARITDEVSQVSMVATKLLDNGEINAAAIVASVNDSESSVAINANKIVLSGSTFFVDKDGNTTTIDGSYITAGTVTANYIDSVSGNIGGFTISDRAIRNVKPWTNDISYYMTSPDKLNSTDAYAGGVVDGQTYDYVYVGIDGVGTMRVVRASNGSNVESQTYMTNGRLFSNNAEITGKITATEGEFTGKVVATSGYIGDVGIGLAIECNALKNMISHGNDQYYMTSPSTLNSSDRYAGGIMDDNYRDYVYVGESGIGTLRAIYTSDTNKITAQTYIQNGELHTNAGVIGDENSDYKWTIGYNDNSAHLYCKDSSVASMGGIATPASSGVYLGTDGLSYTLGDDSKLDYTTVVKAGQILTYGTTNAVGAYNRATHVSFEGIGFYYAGYNTVSGISNLPDYKIGGIEIDQLGQSINIGSKQSINIGAKKLVVCDPNTTSSNSIELTHTGTDSTIETAKTIKVKTSNDLKFEIGGKIEISPSSGIYSSGYKAQSGYMKVNCSKLGGNVSTNCYLHFMHGMLVGVSDTAPTGTVTWLI